MAKIRVLLADDHPVVRGGIRNLLEKEADIEVVGEAANGSEALRLAETLAPDLLLLDMEMPGLQGVEVVRQLRAARSPVQVVALSAHDDRHYILGLLANGAAGYLLKEETPKSIVEAVRGVWLGQKGWLSRRVAAQVAAWTQTDDTDQPDLTERERQALSLVVEGRTNQEIAVALGISEKTVEKHLSSVFSKLGVASRVEAAVYAVREGLF